MQIDNIGELVIEYQNRFTFSPGFHDPIKFLNVAGNLIPTLHIYDSISYPFYRRRYEENHQTDPFRFPEPILVLDLPSGSVFWLYKDIIKKAKNAQVKLGIAGGYGALGRDPDGQVGFHATLPFDTSYSQEGNLNKLKQFITNLKNKDDID